VISDTLIHYAHAGSNFSDACSTEAAVDPENGRAVASIRRIRRIFDPRPREFLGAATWKRRYTIGDKGEKGQPPLRSPRNFGNVRAALR
jgi:hypothetical protein